MLKIFVAVLLMLSSAASADEALQAYIDGVVESMMSDHGIAGLTLAVVADGDVQVEKGYGYADRESRTPVDPEKHLFRIASVTKTMTAIAIMQLVEQGKVNLDADINDYLETFKIPDAFTAPVKVKDLLSHRAGFERVQRGLWPKRPEDFTDLESWLKNNIPDRIFAPGTVTNYSNYGYGLAGYIVQQVSGLAYEDYLETYITKPLAMVNTTARQRLGKNHPHTMPVLLQERLATVYALNGEHPIESPFVLIQSAPSGAISSTASDMSRYMLALLNNGELEGRRILEKTTLLQMRERPYSGRPGPDFTHGFRSGKIAGYTTLEHNGALMTSYISMKMIPELGLGVFVAVNSTDSEKANERIATRILEKIIKNPRPRPKTLAMTNTQAQRFAGKYLTTRRVYSDVTKIGSLVFGHSTVSPSLNNSLAVTTKGKTQQYQRIGPHSFQRVGGNDVIVFERDNHDQIFRYYHPYGHAAYDRLTLDTHPQIFWWALILAAVVALTCLTAIGKHRHRLVKTAYEKWALVTMIMAALLALLSVGSFTAGFYRSMLPMFGVAQVAAILLGGALAIMLLTSPRMLKGSSLTLVEKIHYMLFLLIMLNLMLSLNNWHVIWPLF